MTGQVQPVREGGLPTPSASPYMLELKLTFNEGGAYDFHSKFAEVRERLVQNREMVREIGDNVAPQELHGEQLPAYEERERGLSTPALAQVSNEEDIQAPAYTSNTNATAPRDEPPPGYDEIQHAA